MLNLQVNCLSAIYLLKAELDLVYLFYTGVHSIKLRSSQVTKPFLLNNSTSE